MRLKAIVFSLSVLASMQPTMASASPYTGSDGVTLEFPLGALSWADKVIAYDPLFGGGPAPSQPDAYNDPFQALGPTNFTEPGGSEMVALGNGGRLTLQFTDNFLIGSGNNSPDLAVFEIGLGEQSLVEISKDGITWFSVGSVPGLTATIDIDAFGFGPNDRFSFVRLTDDPNEGPPISSNIVGADIDAVGAISAIGVQAEVPEPATFAVLFVALVALIQGNRSLRSMKAAT